MIPAKVLLKKLDTVLPSQFVGEDQPLALRSAGRTERVDFTIEKSEHYIRTNFEYIAWGTRRGSSDAVVLRRVTIQFSGNQQEIDMLRRFHDRLSSEFPRSRFLVEEDWEPGIFSVDIELRMLPRTITNEDVARLPLRYKHVLGVLDDFCKAWLDVVQEVPLNQNMFLCSCLLPTPKWHVVVGPTSRMSLMRTSRDPMQRIPADVRAAVMNYLGGRRRTRSRRRR